MIFKKKKEAKKEFIMKCLTTNEGDGKNEYAYESYEAAMKDFVCDPQHRFFQGDLDLYVPANTPTTAAFARRTDVEELIKNLVVLDENLCGVYGLLADRGLVKDAVPNFAVEGDLNYYVTKEELESVRKLITKEVKPRYFPGSEGTYFFKILNVDFVSDTPNYWLFLYKEFGYLDEAKLRDYDK